MHILIIGSEMSCSNNSLIHFLMLHATSRRQLIYSTCKIKLLINFISISRDNFFMIYQIIKVNKEFNCAAKISNVENL